MEEQCIKLTVLAQKLERSITNGKKTNLEKRTTGFYENKIAELKKSWSELDNNDTILRELIIKSKESSTHDYIQRDTYSEIQIKYQEYMGELTDGLIQKTAREQPTVPGAGTTVIHTSNIQTQLPRIHLPTFNGEYSSWRSFRDLFTSLVHNNSQLPAVQKLHHLKGCLTGEAERLLKHIPVTAEDYEPAWNKLKLRYENKRVLVNTQLKILTNQPKSVTENSKAIKSLMDTTEECIQQLKAMEIDVSSWDTLLIHLLVQKLPFVTLRLWEEELGASEELPTFEKFQSFLRTRFRVLESMTYAMSQRAAPAQTTKSYHVANHTKCPACNSGHYVGTCSTFLKMNVQKRRKCIEEAKRCFNCFSNKHVAIQCNGTQKCKICEGPHHHLLHLSTSKDTTEGKRNQGKPNYDNHKGYKDNYAGKNDQDNDNTKSFFTTEVHNALLATALVATMNNQGKRVVLRCLVDPGSQTSFITENACQRLGVQGRPAQVKVTGLNCSKATESNRQISLKVVSCHNNKESLKIDMLVINKVTDLLPTAPIHMKRWKHLEGIQLADPQYWKPGPVDILLGAKAYANMLLQGIKRGPKEAPMAINTIFGWVIIGNMPISPVQTVETFVTINNSVDMLNDQIKKFWEIEEITRKPIVKPEDAECEAIFTETHCRLENGQYQVKLPFKNNSQPSFGPSRNLALRRFHQLKSKFKANTYLEEEYTKCLDEYVTLGHMEKIAKITDSGNYYIPHHAVFKESTTTKLRVVFDASARCCNGKSLNEHLLIGPTIQPKLSSTLLKWRKYKIVMTADIEKMYRMILVHPDHRVYQQIIWQNPITKAIEDFRLCTVTFGTSSAPYLAIRTLQQLAIDEASNWPLASKATFSDFYVDDLLTGADTVDEAKELQRQCINMLKAGGFNLRKWASNSAEVLNQIPKEYREVHNILSFDENEVIKTLGIRWYPRADYFTFAIHFTRQNKILTKRSILSEVATLYDPLGWIAPVIILAKILIQTLWIKGYSWDAEVDENIANHWEKFKSKLSSLESLKIPRWIGTGKQTHKIELHGFCDASNNAYAAAIYIRVEDNNGSTRCQLVTAKTKVSPIKPITVPRLELNGALILSRLIKATIQDLRLENVHVTAWTDSMIALQWIKSHPIRWKTYVANRVAEIQELINPDNWRHVPTNQNPADIASRGVFADEIIDNKLWWHGPEWLCKKKDEWPVCPPLLNQPQLEAKKCAVTTLYAELDTDLLLRYSTFSKLIRVTTYVKRFLRNCQTKTARARGYLKAEELQAARVAIFRLIQQSSFQDEYSSLKEGRELSKKSRLLTLTPFVDKNHLMRVGGRLEHANISYDRKHPIILPPNHHVTNILIDQIHLDTLHGGVSLVLNTSRHLYWILDARRTISKRINMCKTCIAYRQQIKSQLMGNLPAPRVNISNPFFNVGIDYAGPINLKMSPHRTTKIYKGYFCIFVCMATKAIHLELVSDLTSTAFLAALKRFVARRGLCKNIYSDCGTNFKGADKTLHKDSAQASNEASEEVAHYLSLNDITWHFNPPAAPHFGGLWEAGVKSVKYHLRRVIGKAVHTYEEYATLLTQIEACVNSRPLCPIGNAVEDLGVLTPGHFLIGRALNAIPEPQLKDQKLTIGHRWKHMQYITHQFWKQWSRDYLNRLQQRPKWTKPQTNLKIGDLVLLKEENTPPTCWPLGRIEQIFPGIDGLVRVAEVRTSSNSFKRPIGKLCALPFKTPTA